MDTSSRDTNLTDEEIRAIIDDTERQALGGWAGAIARAGLGTLALTAAVLASTEVQPGGLVLLGGVFVLGLAAYIRSVVRSVARKPRISAQPVRPGAVASTAMPEKTPDAAALPEATPATVEPPEATPATVAPPESTPVRVAPPETAPVAAPAMASMAHGPIAGGGWSRLAQK